MSVKVRKLDAILKEADDAIADCPEGDVFKPLALLIRRRLEEVIRRCALIAVNAPGEASPPEYDEGMNAADAMMTEAGLEYDRPTDIEVLPK